MTEGSGGDGRIGVGMVGHAFMGAVHSHAWRTAHRFFDLPMVPELAVLGGRDLARTKAAAAKYGWASVQTDWRELVTSDPTCSSSTSARRATRTRRSPSRRSPRASTCCARSRSPTPSRRPRRWRRPRRRPPARGVRSMVAFNYRRVPALALRAQAHRGGPARRRPARPRGVPAGLAVRREGADGLAAAQGQGGLGRARRPRRAHRRRHPVPRGRPAHRRVRDDQHVRPQATDRDAATSTTSPWTTRPLFFGRFANGARGDATRPPGSRSGRKNAMRVEVNGSLGQHARSTSSR